MNDQATIAVSLVSDNNVTVDLYDLSGKKVLSVFEGGMNAGSNTVSFPAARLNAGIYTAIVSVNGFHATVKVAVAK
jgi:hypothetical protein